MNHIYTPDKNFLSPKIYTQMACTGCHTRATVCTYIGETGRSETVRIAKLERCPRLHRPVGSALTEHRMETRHNIYFSNTKILARATHSYTRESRESLEIVKDPNNINRHSDLYLHPTWKLIIPTPQSLRPIARVVHIINTVSISSLPFECRFSNCTQPENVGRRKKEDTTRRSSNLEAKKKWTTAAETYNQNLI